MEKKSLSVQNLLTVPKRSIVKAHGFSIDGKKNAKFKFYSIDGMYSYCETMDGKVFHLSISSEVIFAERF